MRRFFRNLEKEYLVIVFLIVGILLTIFPEPFAKVFPWVLGSGLVLRSILVLILVLHYKDAQHGPGKAILYCAMGLTIMIRGSEATGIIGVIWAVFTLAEVAEEINEMWKEKHFSALYFFSAAVSVALAVMLMVDPFRHFVTHVRILGLEVLSSCFARSVRMIKARVNKDNARDEQSSGR